MSFSKHYKKDDYNGRQVYSKDADRRLIEEYGFKYENNCFGYGYGLQRIIKLRDSSEYLWINLTQNHIYFYQEYECGGKTWDQEIWLSEEERNYDSVLEILDKYID